MCNFLSSFCPFFNISGLLCAQTEAPLQPSRRLCRGRPLDVSCWKRECSADALRRLWRIRAHTYYIIAEARMSFIGGSSAVWVDGMSFVHNEA